MGKGDNRDESGATFMRPPDTQSTKVRMGAGGVDSAVLDKAEALIASLRDDYLTWAAEDITRLEDALARFDAGTDDVETARQDLFRTAHDMKGQGGSFGYDLVTEVGDRLCRLLEAIHGPPTPEQREAAALHVEAMRLVIAQRLEGDGGTSGAALVSGLERTVRKMNS